MLRSELAAAVGCHPETVRYYEKAGLLPAPPRADNGYRVYGPDHRRRLTFVVRARELGFSIAALRDLLDLVDGDAATCAEVRDRCRRQRRDLKARLRHLRKLDQALAGVIAACTGDDTPECAFIEALFDDQAQGLIQSP